MIFPKIQKKGKMEKIDSIHEFKGVVFRFIFLTDLKDYEYLAFQKYQK